MINSYIQQWPLIFAISIALVNLLQGGIIQGWSSPVLYILQSENSTIPLTNDESSWIATALPLASFLATPLGALSLHCLGRKLTILLSALPFIIFWIMVSFATTPLELIIARAISGIGMAFTYTVTPVYLGEIAPIHIRGGIGITMNVFLNIGTLWIYWIGTYPDLWISSLTSAVPILLLFVFYKWLPESPYYLVQTGKPEEAKKVIAKLKNTEEKNEEELQKIEAAIMTESKANAFVDIFMEASHRRALMISLGTFSFAQLTGGVTFIFYAHLIFKKAGDVDANMMSMIKAFLQVLVTITAAYIVDNVGRKPLMLISCIGSSFFMACEGIYFYLLEYKYNVDSIWWLPLVAMILFNISQVIGLQSISILYLGELFHPKVKAIAVCIGKAYMALCIAVVGKLFQIMTDNLGSCVPFFIFSAVGFFGIFFVVFCIPETKGRSFEEIQYYMKNKTYENPITMKL